MTEIFTTTSILPKAIKRDAHGNIVEIIPTEPCPDLLTEEEAIRYLRLDDAKDPAQTLYRYRQKGLLKGTQVGRWVRYRRSELEKFLDNQTREVRR